MNNYQENKFKIRAWLVHFYTSLGLITGLLAIIAIVEQNANLAFFWLGIALIIDATDGTLARKFKVLFYTPSFDGRKLDDITDYLNYAFIPIFFIWRFEIVTGFWVYVLPFVLLSAVYGFCQSGAKTDDGYFTGFPNFWNVLALYLFTFDWPTLVNGIVLLILAFFVFVPIKFVSFSTPGKVKIAKSLSLIYFALLIMIVLYESPILALLSLIFPLIYFGYAIFISVSKRKLLLTDS
jgi:phosphatidylcholine synthase